MQENEIRALYCRTMGALHCPPGLTAPRRRRRRPAAALCAVGLAACGAVAAGGITLHNLQGDALITADHGFGVRIELPLTDPETLPDAVRQDAALMRPFDFENKEDQRRLILNDSIIWVFPSPVLRCITAPAAIPANCGNTARRCCRLTAGRTQVTISASCCRPPVLSPICTR